jgi:formate dehydrogenase subunit gamma
VADQAFHFTGTVLPDGTRTTVWVVDGRVTFEPVYCLGLCASGPAAMLDGKPIARITPERVPALLKEARA